MQRLHPVVLDRQALGTYSDIVTAPQPLGPSGPMDQGHLTATGRPDAELIRSRAMMMTTREVPSYCSFHVNSITLKFPRGSIESGKSPTYQPTTNPSGFISKRAVCQTRRRDESSMSASWLDTSFDGNPYEVDSSFCNVKTKIAIRQSKQVT